MSAISSADNINIQMSFFLILFFLPSLNWEREREREHTMTILRKSGGRKRLYLAFRRVPSESIFSFMGYWDFVTALAWRHQLSSCPRFFLLFPGILAAVSIHLVTPNCCPKTKFFIHISADEKSFWPIIRPLLPSFTLSGDSFRLLYVLILPSLSIRSQNANICWLSFWPGFVTSATRNWPTFLLPLLTVCLLQPVNSNTEG